MSNNVFCLFYKRLSEANPSFDIRYSAVLRFAFIVVSYEGLGLKGEGGKKEGERLRRWEGGKTEVEKLGS
jgi:hypothetical protein